MITHILIFEDMSIKLSGRLENTTTYPLRFEDASVERAVEKQGDYVPTKNLSIQ